MKFLFSILALIMAADSCKPSKNTLESNETEQQFLYGSYTISQIGENKSVSKNLKIIFEENSDKVTGFSGCNSFFGTYVLKNNDITFSNISSSKKICQEEINLIENTFIQSLNKVNSFTIKDNILSLLENKTILISAAPSSVSIKSDIAKDNYKTALTYKTSTRGFFEFIHISKTTISISKDRNLKVIDTYQSEEQNWEELNKLIEVIDLEAFKKLNAPTSKRFSDAAAQANLILKLGDIEYTTPAFDHGHPPKEIEALVNKVLSIKEKATKQ